MAEQINIILVPHTHWDREWYQTFQQFRIRLVHTIDKLLDILDRDPKFLHFMLDGQTIVLDDYLEVRPEQEERLKQHIRSGRILVGPWYLQPDEFLVSGESLIRNLQIGLQRASEFGEPMRVGYVPDCFGHITQLPQILQGVGIDNAVFWRGVGSEAHTSEFYWAAPDGTRILVIHLADAVGYSNARRMPLNPEEFATRVELLTAPLLPKATTNTLLFMNGSDHLEPQDGLPEVIEVANTILSHVDPEHEKILARYSHLAQNGKHYDRINVKIGTLPEYIETIRHHLKDGQTPPLQTLHGEMRSSQYSHLLPSVLSTRMWIKQNTTASEHLLEHWVEPLTAWAWESGKAYPGGLVRLAWRYLLQNHPHDSICGCSIDQVHRENSVRFAQSQQISENLIAQAISNIASATDTRAPIATPHTNHTAIPIIVFNPAPGPRTAAVQTVIQLPGSLRNADIVDERGEHMPYNIINRWRQELGTVPFSRETLAASLALEGANAPGDLIHMTQAMIASIMGQPENAYAITRVHIEEIQPHGIAQIELMITPRGRTTVNEQELYAAERQILELLQREDILTLEVTVVDQARETIDFVATGIPAYGFKTFWMYPRGLQEEEHTPAASSLSADQHSIENEFYRVEADSKDGTLAVTDKQTGATFSGLNRFVDGGDVGDLYTYCPPAHDTLVSAPLEPPKIELVSKGPVRAILRVSGRWLLPSSCTANRTERSSRTTFCTITSEITLIPGVRRIDMHTSVENKVKDHRLRVIFPVPYTVKSAAAEGTFEVRWRPAVVPLPADVSEWAEEPVNTFPQKRFVDISNGTIGLGVLNRGLPEYEVIDLTKTDLAPATGQTDGIVVAPLAGARQAVAITLLRCVEWLSRGDLSTRRGHAGPMEHTPEAQCLGHHEFDYALVPHSGDWEAEEALVLREAQAFNIPVRSIVTEQHEGQGAINRAPTLPSRASVIEVEPRDVVVSAIKRGNDGKGLIVRIYNPLSHAVEATLRPTGIACSKAFVANLLEEQQEQLFWSGEEDAEPLHIGLRAGEIMTILFQ